MGALFPLVNSKQELVNLLMRNDSNEARTRAIIAHSLRGNNLWSVAEIQEKQSGKTYRIIVLDSLIYRKDDGWGYTSWSEDAGLVAYDCPVYFFGLAPNPRTPEEGSKAIEWREKVKAAAKHKRRKLEVGATYAALYCKIKEATIVSVKPLRITAPGDTQVYKISKKLIGERIR